MLFDSSVYSQKYINFVSKKRRKRGYSGLREKRDKRLLKKSFQDEKLIYAFFLDIA
tara:strand:- start:1664 stop:1831 length:168 start_codon:yes stop_codon:yes gene_type:complete